MAQRSTGVILLVVVALSGVAGCTYRMVDFTLIATQNVEISGQRGPTVEGRHCVPVVFFPLGVPNMEEAIERAVASAGDEYDALEDGVLYYQNWSFLFGSVCYEIRGRAIASGR